MAIAPAAKRPFADPKQLCRLHLAQLRPLRSTENIGKAHPSYPLVNACPIHPNPPSQEVQMTGHFTSYKTRPNHELATLPDRSPFRCAVLAVLYRHLLDIEAQRQAFPRLKAEVDHLDLAGAARLRLVLQRMLDQRASGVGVMDAEDLNRLIRLRDLV